MRLIKASQTTKKILLLGMAILLVLPVFMSSLPSYAAVPQWGTKGSITIREHAFRAGSDATSFTDQAIALVEGKEQAIEVEYSNKTPINFWDFFDKGNFTEYQGKTTGDSDFGYTVESFYKPTEGLKEQNYSAYKLAGTNSFYLIVNESARKTEGIFKEGVETICKDKGRTSDIVSCPWKYYKAGTEEVSTKTGGDYNYYYYFVKTDGKNQQEI